MGACRALAARCMAAASPISIHMGATATRHWSETHRSTTAGRGGEGALRKGGPVPAHRCDHSTRRIRAIAGDKASAREHCVQWSSHKAQLKKATTLLHVLKTELFCRAHAHTFDTSPRRCVMRGGNMVFDISALKPHHRIQVTNPPATCSGSCSWTGRRGARVTGGRSAPTANRH
jgi:hypothetical protein